MFPPRRTLTALILLTAPLAAPRATGADQPARVDRYGDPLPPRAVARLGTVRLRAGDGVFCVAYSPDGKVLASGGEKDICLWDPATGKEVRRLIGHTDTVYGLAFSPDGRRLASGGMDKAARVWDGATGKELCRLGQPGGVIAVAFSPDGSLLASAGYEYLRVWQVRSGKSLHFLHQGAYQLVTAVAFSPDGKTLAFAEKCQFEPGTPNAPPVPGKLNGIRLWDLSRGKEARRWETGKVGEHALAFTPDGKKLVSGGEGVRFWRVADGKEVGRLPGRFPGPVKAVAFARDGKTLVVAPIYGPVELWQVATRKRVGKFGRKGDGADGVALSPDGRTLAAGDGHAVRLWDTATGDQLKPGAAPHQAVNWVAWSPDGRRLASGGWWDDLHLWDPATGAELRRVPGTARDAWGTAAYLDDRTLASVGGGGLVTRWDAASGKVVSRFRPKVSEPVFLAFSPRGNLVAGADGEGNVSLWDQGTGKKLRDLDYPPREREQGKPSGSVPFYRLTFSPDGRVLALTTTWCKALQMWDVETGRRLPPLTVPAAGPREGSFSLEVAFSADGRTLAAWWQDTLYLFEVASGRERGRVGARRDFAAVAWSPDGRLLATGGYDGSLRFWDPGIGKEVARLAGHQAQVDALAFSPDGSRLASCGRNTTVLVWDVAGLVPQPARVRDLTGPEQAALWNDLAATDAARAYRAIRELAAAPRQAVSLLDSHLQPAPVKDREVIRLLTDLDSRNFKARSRARKELARRGLAVFPALERYLKKPLTPEARRQAERLRQQLETASPPLELLRNLRAVEALELMNTPQARQILQKLSRGGNLAPLTRAAQAALDRLARRGNVDR